MRFSKRSARGESPRSRALLIAARNKCFVKHFSRSFFAFPASLAGNFVHVPKGSSKRHEDPGACCTRDSCGWRMPVSYKKGSLRKM